MSSFSNKELRGQWLIEVGLRERLVVLLREGERHIDLSGKLDIIKVFNDMLGATEEVWGDNDSSTTLMALAR